MKPMSRKKRAEAIALEAALNEKFRLAKLEFKRAQRECEAEALRFENLKAFWELTGGKYKFIGELMESPEGVDLRKLWTGKLAAKYPRFTDFLASPEAAEWRQRYGFKAI
jgi:hypothetical protein